MLGASVERQTAGPRYGPERVHVYRWRHLHRVRRRYDSIVTGGVYQTRGKAHLGSAQCLKGGGHGGESEEGLTTLEGQPVTG